MELERHSNGVMMVDGVVIVAVNLAMVRHLQTGCIEFSGPIWTIAIAIGRVVVLLLVLHGGAGQGHQPDVVLMVGEADCEWIGEGGKEKAAESEAGRTTESKRKVKPQDEARAHK